MKIETEEDYIKNLKEVLEQFDKIDEDEDVEIINFMEKHYDILINYNSEDIEIINEIADTLAIYFFALGECNYWTDIINKRKEIITFVEKLKGKREVYKEIYSDIEIVYCDALVEQGRNYRTAFNSLKELNKLSPRDESIILKMRRVNYLARFKQYKIIGILIMIIGLGSMTLRLFVNTFQLKLVSDFFWFGFVGIFLIQSIDSYISNKMPSS